MRVTTFSRQFQANHPRKGDPTQFVEKILLSFIEIAHISMGKAIEIGRHLNLPNFQSYNDLRRIEIEPKHHTIRAGNRWKAGEKFSPRIWSGMPYRSKQIEFAPPVEIVKVWDYEVDECGVPSVGGFYTTEEQDELIARNDGLSSEDFDEWIIMPCFRKGKAFKGQIICWNPEVEYCERIAELKKVTA